MNLKNERGYSRNQYLQNITSEKDPDMSDEARVSYMLNYPEFMDDDNKCKNGFRGDTLQSCGWTFGKANKFSNKFNPKERSYGRLFNEEEIKIIDKFRLNYHCIANFAVLPQQLNIWRGAIKEGLNDKLGHGQCDYFDILIDIIRSYYMNQSMPLNAKTAIFKHKEWLDLFGRGEKGWRSFVDYYNFTPYVNHLYEVKDLFAMNSSYKKTDCQEIVGVHHGWDYCLPLCSSNGAIVSLEIAKQRALNYAENSLWIWEERSKLMDAFVIPKKFRREN